MPAFVFGTSGLSHCCGFTSVGNFSLNAYAWGPAPLATQGDQQNCVTQLRGEIRTRSNKFVACFIDTEECKVAYEYFASNYRLVFQSEPETNRVHGSQVFMCIFEKLD